MDDNDRYDEDGEWINSPFEDAVDKISRIVEWFKEKGYANDEEVIGFIEALYIIDDSIN